MESTPRFIQHVEHYFGSIERSWTVFEGTDPVGFLKVDVIEGRTGLVADVTVASTLGLSHFPLASVVSEKKIRQELFLMMKAGQFHDQMPGVLGQIAEERVDSNSAVLRGEVIEKHGPLFESEKFVALFATLPIYYPEEAWTFRKGGNEAIVLTWLLPITERENGYVRKNGWSKFEDILNEARCDLYDLHRPSLI